MTAKPDIRESRPEDLGEIDALYEAAFPDEELIPLVRDLLEQEDGVESLVAVRNGTVAGHIAFTICAVEGAPEKVALLAPLAVLPAFRKHGIGRALIRAGIDRVQETGVARICVLGDPAWYGPFGFEREDGIGPPYPLPPDWRDAWQSMALDDPPKPLAGTLTVPGPWRNAALWS